MKEKFEKRIGELIEKNLKLSKSNAVLKFKLYSLTKENEKLKMEISALTGEIQFLKKALENVKEKLKRYNEDIF